VVSGQAQQRLRCRAVDNHQDQPVDFFMKTAGTGLARGIGGKSDQHLVQIGRSAGDEIQIGLRVETLQPVSRL
jgi:hypothetical protein